ncbi:MAG: caspase family protein [Nodosilinea sp.]
MAIRKRWAFLVGINRYSDYGSLSYCVDDVLALETLLTAANYTVVCLHDRLDRDNQDGKPNRLYPTVDNIRAEFACLCSAIQAGENQGQDDLLLVYFACHGTRHSDDQPRLVATDTRKKLLADRAISIAEIEQGMNRSGAECKILMLDACHIGLSTTTRAPEDPELLRKIHDLAKGYALLAASTDQQDAHEWDGVKHGVFSFYALSGLDGKADLGGKNYVTVMDLAEYILGNLQDWQVRQGVDQVPQVRIEGTLGNFILIDNCQGLQQTIAVETAQLEPARSSQGVQSRGQVSAQVADCLWSLDCKAQCDAFYDQVFPSTRRAAAFVVQAKDSRIQRWLVKRLAKQIPNDANARVFPFVVPAHPMWTTHDFGALWIDLARTLQCSAEPATVIDALVEVYRTKSIIMAMYDWPDRPRSQTLQQQVLDELWQPLVEAVGALEGPQPLRSRIILFLAEAHDLATARGSKDPASSSVVPLRLAPLAAIKHDDIHNWMISNPVFPHLSRQIPQELLLGRLINEEILEWDTDPAAAIQQICYKFKLENGIADIEAEWRLAG